MSDQSFSQRKGLSSVRSELQLDAMDRPLRVGLWNVFYRRYLSDTSSDNAYVWLIEYIHVEFLKEPVDQIEYGYGAPNEQLRNLFMEYQWFRVYDFVELIGRTSQFGHVDQRFINGCNEVFEKEGSGYRFVGEIISPITSGDEIEAIEQAMGLAGSLQPVSTHLHTALSHLSDRESPDYRNSIKESISAVETLSKIVAKTPKATLTDALKAIQRDGEFKLHGALSEAFKKLYSWTSDDQGIRHSLMDEPNLEFEDAMFMLVSCSAFTNYLVAKAERAGIAF